MAWVCSGCALGLFGLAGQVLKYRLPGPYPLAHLFHAHPRGESYCDFSAVVTLVFSTSIACCTQALCLVTASGAHDGSSVLPLPFVFFPSDHLRAVLEGSLFWGGSSCVVDIPQGLMTSVPYDQPDCWFFCLPATAFGPSTDSLACTSMRKDCQDKAAARSPVRLGVVLRSDSTLLCSSLNLLKTWFLDLFFKMFNFSIQVLGCCGLFFPLDSCEDLRDICVLCSQHVMYNPSFYLLNFP